MCYVLDATDPFPKLHRLVHNGGFPKFEAVYCIPNMVNSTEISENLKYNLPNYEVSSNSKVITVFEYIRHYGPVILLLCMTTSKTGLQGFDKTVTTQPTHPILAVELGFAFCNDCRNFFKPLQVATRDRNVYDVS